MIVHGLEFTEVHDDKYETRYESKHITLVLDKSGRMYTAYYDSEDLCTGEDQSPHQAVYELVCRLKTLHKRIGIVIADMEGG